MTVKLLKNKYFVFVFSLFMGYLCWQSALYIFTFGTAETFPYLHAHTKSSGPLIKHIINFVYFHITEFVLVGLFSFVLASLFGRKIIWFIAFMIWPIGFPLFSMAQDLLYYMSEFAEGIPKWTSIHFVQSILAYFLISPLFGFGGFILGGMKFNKKHNI